jgi:hypothetical protein
VLEALLKERDFDLCGFICNQGKHLVLTHKKYSGRTLDVTSSEIGDCIGGGPIAAAPISGTETEWHFQCDGNDIDPIALADRIIQRWETFFVANGIV